MYEQPGLKCYSLGDNLLRRLVDCVCDVSCTGSNGWSPTTAALQLFAHLDGEALNVALLMPVEEREQWTAFARGLSDYFNSPVDWRRSGGDSRA